MTTYYLDDYVVLALCETSFEVDYEEKIPLNMKGFA